MDGPLRDQLRLHPRHSTHDMDCGISFALPSIGQPTDIRLLFRNRRGPVSCFPTVLVMSPLIALILVPVITVFTIACGANARRISLIGTCINLGLCVFVLINYHSDQAGYQFVCSLPIIPSVGLNFTLGADGLTLMLLFLSTLISFAAVLVSRKIEQHESWFYICLLLISAGAIGAFVSLNVLFFYSFHELALIPTFLLIGIWGHGDKQSVAWKTTLYLAIGSFILLLGIIGLYFACPVDARTFDMRELRHLGANGMIRQESWIYLLLVIGFGALVSLFPLHSWAPAAYACAPTPVAMLHAGVLKKFGLYGFFRIVTPLFPLASQQWMTLLLILAAGNLLFIGMATLAQKRLDWMLGYSSVMHMGYIFLGLAAGNVLALTGAATLIFAHGLSIAALFALCGELRERTGTVDFNSLGGLAGKMPHMGVLFGLAGFASIGVPGFANFAGELMVFFGAFQQEATPFKLGRFQIIDILIMWGVVLSAVYFLRAYRRIFFGAFPQRLGEISDLRPAVELAVIVLVIALLAVGCYPQPFLQMIIPSLTWH
ncbi:MAG: NADH-quinone oxidoreductase subunit M [Verrucomicrobia bacterium]|nr:MAG: NADH-quinone oxidoreductase subunit M [Verrucomicrobiota bacterium]